MPRFVPVYHVHGHGAWTGHARQHADHRTDPVSESKGKLGIPPLSSSFKVALENLPMLFIRKLMIVRKTTRAQAAPRTLEDWMLLCGS